MATKNFPAGFLEQFFSFFFLFRNKPLFSDSSKLNLMTASAVICKMFSNKGFKREFKKKHEGALFGQNCCYLASYESAHKDFAITTLCMSRGRCL